MSDTGKKEDRHDPKSEFYDPSRMAFSDELIRVYRKSDEEKKDE